MASFRRAHQSSVGADDLLFVMPRHTQSGHSCPAPFVELGFKSLYPSHRTDLRRRQTGSPNKRSDAAIVDEKITVPFGLSDRLPFVFTKWSSSRPFAAILFGHVSFDRSGTRH